jgi:hypothetical protein
LLNPFIICINSSTVSILLPNNTKGITGSQFRIGFDNTRLSFDKVEYSKEIIDNFSALRSNYINVGSVSINGKGNLNEGIEYKIYFKSNQTLDSILGLVSLQKVELLSQEGIQIQSIVK